RRLVWGEPLLAKEAIRELSAEFIKICRCSGIPYRAQVITNGTILDDDIADLLLKAEVDRLQITLDGPMDVHDLRRPYKAGRKSSFSSIVSSLPSVIGQFIVRLR